jgi:predicted ATPase
MNVRGEHFYESEVYRLKGELLLAQTPSAETEAETLFRQAFEVAHRQGAKLFELRAVTSLARLLHAQRKHEEAREKLQHTYSWFTEGFETPDLKEAQDLIALLS